MSIPAMVVPWTRRRESRREAGAEERPFVSMYERQKKNRLSQLLLVVEVAALFAGGSLTLVGSLVGFVLVVVGLPVTVGTAVWIFKHWDY